jgi:hypothetical protein
MEVANNTTYYDTATITEVKSFVALALECRCSLGSNALAYWTGEKTSSKKFYTIGDAGSGSKGKSIPKSNPNPRPKPAPLMEGSAKEEEGSKIFIKFYLSQDWDLAAAGTETQSVSQLRSFSKLRLNYGHAWDTVRLQKGRDLSWKWVLACFPILRPRSSYL